MKKITTYLLFLLSIILLVNCSSDSEENAEQILGTISTDDIINITTSSATFGGNLTSSGSSDVTAKGVVFGTNLNPTIDDNVELSNDNNLGSFTITKTGLTPNTTYYVRAFATNSIGTSYGEEKTFTTSPLFQATCLPTNLQNGVIAFYPFSSGSLNDYSGYNRHLTNPTTASSTTDRSGNSNCAYNFVISNNDYLTFINPTFINDFNSNPFSISIWIKTSGSRDAGDYESIISRGSGLQNCVYGQWSLGLHDLRQPTFNINQKQIWYSQQLGEVDFLGGQNSWHHLVISFDGDDSRKIYVDGQLTTDTQSSGLCGIIASNVGDLFIGKEFNGLIDDVIIYNKVLNNSEVTQLYNLSGCCN